MIPIAAAIVAAAGAGIWAERRYGGRAALASRRSLTVALYAVLPIVTFFNLARAELDADVGIGILLAYVALAAAAVAAWWVATRLLRLTRPGVGAVICCALVANTGYLGYPMVIALLGADRLSEAVVYDVVVSVPALLLAGFSIGAAFGERAGDTPRQRVGAFFARNPALYAAGLALVAPDSLAPDVLVDLSRVLVVAILPLGFFAVGAALAEEAEVGELRVPPPLTAPVATAVAARVALVPGVLFLLALPLIDLPGPYLLLAAMPSGINTMIVAHAYGLDLRITAEAVTWSTALVVIVASAFAIA